MPSILVVPIASERERPLSSSLLLLLRELEGIGLTRSSSYLPRCVNGVHQGGLRRAEGASRWHHLSADMVAHGRGIRVIDAVAVVGSSIDSAVVEVYAHIHAHVEVHGCVHIHVHVHLDVWVHLVLVVAVAVVVIHHVSVSVHVADTIEHTGVVVVVVVVVVVDDDGMRLRSCFALEGHDPVEKDDGEDRKGDHVAHVLAACRLEHGANTLQRSSQHVPGIHESLAHGVEQRVLLPDLVSDVDRQSLEPGNLIAELGYAVVVLLLQDVGVGVVVPSAAFDVPAVVGTGT